MFHTESFNVGRRLAIGGHTLRDYVFIIICALCLALPSVGFAKMYRWIGPDGKVFYSDQVPPEETQVKKESLSKTGRVEEVIEGAKTKEQWELDKRLEMLRKEQEKIIAKRKADDKVLLSTFRSEDDMRAVLKNKVMSIEGQQRVVEGNVLRLEQQLTSQQRDAAKYEREGKAVPPSLIKDIAKTNQQIADAKKEVEKQEQRKQQIIKEFEADIARFLFLTKSNIPAEQVSDSSAELNAADALGVVTCDNEEHCAKVWGAARSFVQKYSSVPTYVDNELLVMGEDPRTEDDMSLSVSRIELKKSKVQVFLDIRCYKSSKGTELCSGDKAKQLRSSFRPFVESALSAQQ